MRRLIGNDMTEHQANRMRSDVGPLRQDARVPQRVGPLRGDWLPSALSDVFGPEPDHLHPGPELRAALTAFRANALELSDDAAHAAAELPDANVAFLKSDSDTRNMPPVETESHSPMRVVLMGRTMAGKSSILTALCGSHHERIGDGRQRFSRDIFGAPMADSSTIELIDTPGVGAHSGTDDTEIALAAALTADVILWVNSSDSIQQESATALKLLGVIGKPIIVVLNCRQSLAGVGRLNLLRFPERVFGKTEGLLHDIQRHMAEAGVKPVDVVHVHALAAAEWAVHAGAAPELHTASRISDLTSALVKEQTSRSETRRALRLVDQERNPAQGLCRSLQVGASTLRAQAQRDRGLAADLHQRLGRLVRATGEALTSDIETAVGRRRGWHLDVTDFGASIPSAWTEAMTDLQDELQAALTGRLNDLAQEIDLTIAATTAEWSHVSLDRLALHDLTAFDAIWGNRVMRAGVGIGGSLLGFGGGAWLGTKIGLAIGLATGPAALVTAGAGFVVGGVAGLVVDRTKGLVDHIVLGKSGVLHKRRTEVAKQIDPILDDLSERYQSAIQDRLTELSRALAHEHDLNDRQSAALERVASAWMTIQERLAYLVRDLDRQTTTALLRLNGRERLARSVTKATRVPGACILAEFEERAFWEAWLFPPDLGETLACGRVPTPGGEAAAALSYALGLIDAPWHLVTADATSALLQIDAAVPASISRTWSDGLTAHTGKNIRIVTSQRSDAP
ncbi:hypothetical protein GCM10027425_02280 [Alteromonas gracilis]